jgi:hypothetical protein
MRISCRVLTFPLCTSARHGTLIMTPESALELVAELEHLIEQGGREDPSTLAKVETIILSLQGTGEMTGILDHKIYQVHSWAQILFSDRKQQRWRRAADDIKNILRVHCISLREMVHGAIESAKPQPPMRPE